MVGSMPQALCDLEVVRGLEFSMSGMYTLNLIAPNRIHNMYFLVLITSYSFSKFSLQSK